MKNHPILSATNLTKQFGKGATTVRAVDDVSLDIYPRELVLIMGPSGSGKTTLISMLGSLLTPTSGRIEFDGVEITSLTETQLPKFRAQKIGFIFQAFNLLDAFTVEENILFPAQLISGNLNSAIARAERLMADLDLDKRRDALPKTLSGGEKQRVAIARALINAPPIILADEPTGNLDSQKGQEVMMILHDIARDQGCAVVIVTHDPRVEDIADRILWLEDGVLRDRKAEQHKWVRDPVCGMQVDEWTATMKLSLSNETYVFCSQRCLDKFQSNPDKYRANSADVM